MNKIPKHLLDQIAEHTDSFVIFYFDSDGVPCVLEDVGNGKDQMAILALVHTYLNQHDTAGTSFTKYEENPEEEDEEGDDSGDSWKK